MKKFLSKVKSLANRGKAAIVAAVAACSAAAVSVCASAATVEAPASNVNMELMMQSAGEQLTSTFSSLVISMIPVILGILTTGLTIFGIIVLIKLAKKIFTKVAS